MDPVVSKHGFSLQFGTDQSKLEGHYGITCKVMHDGGHSELERADIPIDRAGIKGSVNKTATHAFGSTMTYGRRYLKMMVFDVATSDNDGNREPEPKPIELVSPDQVLEMHAFINENGLDLKAFLGWASVSNLEQLHASNFDTAMNALRKKASS